ncbi:MAG: IS21 family transposase, partial [Gemmatimonadetes bacterium]|nr:IS21 family transposase [Gemmatimonadota bacterium]
IVTAPGEEGQVDYGDGPMVRHPGTGKYRRTRLFLFTLGYSRTSVRLLTFASSTRRWCELHEESFRRLGGTVQVVVLDNLREGVLTPDIYDPALNPLYRDVLAHYGVVALPCRVGDPDRKGKVEAAIGHTQAALKGLRFETLEAAQAYLDRWDARWASTRIHGTTKRQVAAMFAEERPTLRPLPVEPFRYYQFGTRTVHLDGCVEIDAAYYGAPPGWLGRAVAVQWDSACVRLLDPATGQLLREHRRQATRGRHVIHPDDRPARTPPTTVTLLAQAARAGTSIGSLCATIHRRDGELGVRRILGVLGLVKKHGAPAVDAACATALDLDVADYRFVRRYLERHPAAPLTLRQVDPLIRELTHYRDVIAHKTQEEIPT